MARSKAPLRPSAPDLPAELLPGPDEVSRGDELDGVYLDSGALVAESCRDLTLMECELRNVDLQGRRLDGLHARDVLFVGCDLAGAEFARAQLTRVRFESCRLTGASFSETEMLDVEVTGGLATMLLARGADLRRVWWRDVNLTEADFSESQLRDCAFLGCDLAAADFRAIKAKDTRLHRSQVAGLRSPSALAPGLQISAEQVGELGIAVLGELGVTVTNDDS